jgi:wobble nucleotide-excising tRNase
MAVSDNAASLLGISNENEFYAAHYLSEVFSGDIKDTLANWQAKADAEKEAGISQPYQMPFAQLKQIANAYFLARERGQKERNDSNRWSMQLEFSSKLLAALGFNMQPQQLLVSKDSELPVLLCYPNLDQPQLLVVCAFDVDKDGEDPLSLTLHKAQFEGNGPHLFKLAGNTWFDLINDVIFKLPEPPRWVMLISDRQLLLIDRYKWLQNRLLRFDLDEILGRKDDVTLKATAALLHQESLVPLEGNSLLDSLDENAHRHAFGVSEDLKYALREAIELLGNEAAEQLIERKDIAYTGKTALDPDQLSRECLRYMYRMLFLFYIEARPDLAYVPIQSEAYRKGYSLEALRDLEMVKLTSEDTLGENQVQAEAEIATLRPQVEEQNNKIKSLNTNLDGNDEQAGKRKELFQLEIAFREKAWKQKQKHDDYFQHAFTGVRGNQENFKSKVLQELTTNKAELHDLLSLKERAKTIYAANQQQATSLPTFNFDEISLLESNAILQKKIVGSQDVSIAALINQLGNADWVKQGLHFHDAANATCPFCQQPTSVQFSNELSQFFDGAYQADLQEVANLKSKYESVKNTVNAVIASVKQTNSEFLDNSLFSAEAGLLEDLLARNLQVILNKTQEPSRKLALESISDLTNKFVAHISAANTKIVEHNQIVSNIGNEKKQLTAQIWRFVLNELIEDISVYQIDKTHLESTIQGMERSFTAAQTRKREIEEQIKTLERLSTSIQPTKDEINSLLRTFGFTSFKLEVANELGQYKISRADGGDARKSLSEGEKTFITFLYFYSLIKGAQTAEGTSTNRIVVFDDPISSLDSDVLYIVSSLIKGVFEQVRTQSSNIKQVFVLTHNVYFHKEVSFNVSRPKDRTLNEESFWIVKKQTTGTVVERCLENPIKSAYELLWGEVKSANRSSQTLQNTLRRILENYFTMWGGLGKDEICNKFEGREKLICQSLFSWVNDGSHSIHDDLYVSYGEQTNSSYLEVFKEIFIRSRQQGHYNMMMGVENNENNEVVAA